MFRKDFTWHLSWFGGIHYLAVSWRVLTQLLRLSDLLADPDWASHSLGIFICLNCSGIHRNIPQVSKVKSVRLDDWDDAQVEFMASNGNNVAKAKYESKMPPFYYKPTFLDCQ
uniref:Arf-GAP domain-containing protein n=1 Tax=Meleagris gallopavo TaxID=9103 RepID=A0A803Y0B9_MELGA